MNPIPSELVQSPAFGVAVTLTAYAAALALRRKWKWIHPLFVTSGAVMLLLLAARIPYQEYQIGGQMLSFFLGPATVALAVPLYKNAARIKEHFLPIMAALVAGSVSSLATTALFVWLLHGSRELLLTLLPRSVTSPVAIEIVRNLGGVPELGAVVTVLAGLLGSMVGPEVLKLAGIRSDIAIGTAVGTICHGIGTGRVLQDSELQGSVSGFCMAMNAIVTSVLVIPLYSWLAQ